MSHNVLCCRLRLPEPPHLMAAVAEALTARDEATFLRRTGDLLAQALLDTGEASTSSADASGHGRGRLKALPDLLADTGNPISCPFCSVPLARGPTARVCLACGKALGPIPAVLDERWEASCAHARFLQSLSIPDGKAAGAASGSAGAGAVVPSEQGSEAGASAAAGSRGEVPGPLFEPESLLGGAVGDQAADGVAMFETLPTSTSASNPDKEPAVPFSQADGDDFFSQLSGLQSVTVEEQPLAGPGPAKERHSSGDPSPALKAILSKVPDLTFMLSDSLVFTSHRTAFGNGVADSAARAAASDNMVRVLENMLQMDDESDTDEWGDFSS